MKAICGRVKIDEVGNTSLEDIESGAGELANSEIQ